MARFPDLLSRLRQQVTGRELEQRHAHELIELEPSHELTRALQRLFKLRRMMRLGLISHVQLSLEIGNLLELGPSQNYAMGTTSAAAVVGVFSQAGLFVPLQPQSPVPVIARVISIFAGASGGLFTLRRSTSAVVSAYANQLSNANPWLDFSLVGGQGDQNASQVVLANDATKAAADGSLMGEWAGGNNGNSDDIMHDERLRITLRPGQAIVVAPAAVNQSIFATFVWSEEPIANVG